MDRLDQLKAFLAENPNDSFIRYAIALEYIKKGDNENGRSSFETLVKNDPDYVGTYYHLAKLYKKMGLSEEAGNCYKEGIEIATKINDMHALGELKNAYTNFQMGLDDDDE